MLPTAFDQENTILNPPPGISVEQCECISVWAGGLENGVPVVISCWKVTKEELEEIQRTGRVWLVVMGYSMPPVMLHGTNPFEE